MNINNLIMQSSIVKVRYCHYEVGEMPAYDEITPEERLRYENFDSPEEDFDMKLFNIKELGQINGLNGRTNDRSYLIQFNTFYGYLFQHNVLTLNTDLIPSKLYDLPLICQDFYRKIILTNVGSKIIRKPDTIRRYINLKTRHKSMLKKVISSVVEQLTEEGFFESWSFENGNFVIRRKPWKELEGLRTKYAASIS